MVLADALAKGIEAFEYAVDKPRRIRFCGRSRKPPPILHSLSVLKRYNCKSHYSFQHYGEENFETKR